MSHKIVILIEENPEVGTFSTVANLLGLRGIDPLDFIEPESHMLSEIYKDVFNNRTANELMGYLIQRKGNPMVFDILNAIHNDEERLVLVNTTLLADEDISLLANTVSNLLTYRLAGDPQDEATKIYDASKAYRDKLDNASEAPTTATLGLSRKY